MTSSRVNRHQEQGTNHSACCGRGSRESPPAPPMWWSVTIGAAPCRWRAMGNWPALCGRRWKPFQALAVATSGGLERYHLGDRHLAILCRSHQGTMAQVRQVFEILWRARFNPAGYSGARVPASRQSPLQHNCSGKHAACWWSANSTTGPWRVTWTATTQVQKMILARIADLLAMPADEFVTTHDDCGAPTSSCKFDKWPVVAMLASGNSLEMERIIRAMTHYPEMVGGRDSLRHPADAAHPGGAWSVSLGRRGISVYWPGGGKPGAGHQRCWMAVARARYAAAIFTLERGRAGSRPRWPIPWRKPTWTSVASAAWMWWGNCP
jgi:L-asparaginase